MGYKRRSSSTK